MSCGWMALVGLLFEVYLCQAPVLNGKNVSAQSNTPNETLVTGLLLTEKPLPRAMAFQDLEYMAYNNPIQRKQLFLQTEPEPTVWQQIVKICLDTLTSSIQPFQISEISPQQPIQSPQPANNVQTSSPSPLSVRNENIFLPGPSRKRLTDHLKVNSITHTPVKSPVQVQALIKPRLALAQIQDRAKKYVSYFLESNVGVPFRHTIALQGLNKLPEVNLPIEACRALTEICCTSAVNDEDPYGCISKELPTILQTYCNTIQVLERSVKNPGIHWTDIESLRNPDSAKMDNVNELLACLRKSLKDVNEVFGRYLSDARLPQAVLDMCAQCSKYFQVDL